MYPVLRCTADDDTPYTSTYVIGPVGLASDNGTALLAAYQAIPPPSDDAHSVLVKLEPGEYQLPAGASIELAAWVTIEGSGAGSTLYHPTTIVGDRCGPSHQESAIVTGEYRAALRNLAVKNTCAGSSSFNTAISNEADWFSLRDVQAQVIGTAARTVGVANSGLNCTFDGVQAFASGAAISNHAIYNSGNHMDLSDSWVRAQGLTSTSLAIGIYNIGEYLAIARSTIDAQHANTTYGVSGTGYLATLRDVSITASTAAMSLDDSHGLQLKDSSMRAYNGVAVVLRVPVSSVIENQLAELHGSTLIGSSRALDALVYSQSLIVVVDGSAVKGDVNYSIRALDADVLIGATRFVRGTTLPQGTGSTTCAGVWDADFTFYPNTCP